MRVDRNGKTVGNGRADVGNGGSVGAVVDAASRPSAGAGALPISARNQLHAAIGQVVLTLSVVPRYRHCTLAEIHTLVVEPLLKDRLAIATGKAADGADDAEDSLAGIAIWASLSEEAEARLREQIAAGVFPVRLKPADWASGDRVWLLDVIAPTRQLASVVLANLRQVLPSDELSVHPVAAAQVESELLNAMRKAAGAGAA
jgi:hemolysin-activating ACP:hemolysin acyltransferase